MAGRGMRSGRIFKGVSTITFDRLHGQAAADLIGVSSTVDLSLAIYPIILFWDLRIQTLKKLTLSVLFAFGIVYVDPVPSSDRVLNSIRACICSIVRTVHISRLGQTKDLTREQHWPLFPCVFLTQTKMRWQN